MRVQRKQGFRISVETLISKNIEDFRENLRQIKFDAELNILALQPGLGKSYKITDTCNHLDDDVSFGIYTNHHNLLDWYQSKIPFAAHWYGFTYLCHSDEMKEIYQLIGSPATICGYICKDKKECEYLKQFKAKKILAPSNFLHIKTKSDIVFIDENIMQVDEIRKTEPKVAALISDSFAKSLKNNDLKWFQYNKRRLYARYEERKKDLIKKKEWGYLKKLLKVNLDEQLFLVRKKLGVWYRPYLYSIFELAQEKRVVMSCATFGRDYFEDMIKSYSGEIGFNKKEITVRIYYSKMRNRGTIVYHINPSNNYRKAAPSDIVNTVKTIKTVFPDVGVIGDMKTIEALKNEGVDGLYFGNAEGLNTFEKRDVILKTRYFLWNIIGSMDLYKKHYLELDLPDCTKDGDALSFIEKHYPKKALEFNDWYNEATNYDAMHRSRGLIRDASIINFGVLPKRIYDEYTIKEVSDVNGEADITDIASFISERIKESKSSGLSAFDEEEQYWKEMEKRHEDEMDAEWHRVMDEHEAEARYWKEEEDKRAQEADMMCEEAEKLRQESYPVPSEPADEPAPTLDETEPMQAAQHFTIALNIKVSTEFSEHEDIPVPDDVFDLWKQRGYSPCKTGIAKVRFENNRTEYTYPLYFNLKPA
jgi:hypothetical protein